MLSLTPPILVLAVLWLDLALGPIRFALRFVPAPPVVMGRVARSLSRRLDRPNRTESTLKARGAAVGLLLCGGAILVGVGIDKVLADLPRPAALAVEVLILWGFLRAHLPLARLRAGAKRIGSDGEAAAAVRALLEQTAVSFVHFVVGPIFWFLLAGLPAVFAAAAAWAVDRAAREAGNHRPFGAFAAGLEYLTSWVPARIAELVLAIAAATVPRGRPFVALREGWGNAPLGQYGTVAALAGGLGVALPAPDRRWLGDGTARIGRNELLRATWLYVMALLVATGVLILFAIVERFAFRT